ncbi:MAG: hypothetical protein H0X33_13120 [Taibaiella sp.]|nr:hypothetical protein [Taibaiella sp.]
MTIERHQNQTEQQIEEKARSLQKQLCNDQRLFEQLKLLVGLDRGGIIKLIYNVSPNLQKVGYEQQL